MDAADVLIATDDPDHAWQRKLVSRLFTPRAISDLEPKVRMIAAAVLDEARDQGALDVVIDFSGYLPMMVIAEMLGVPEEARGDLRRLSDRMLDRSDTAETGKMTEEATIAIRESHDILGQIVEEKAKTFK